MTAPATPAMDSLLACDTGYVVAAAPTRAEAAARCAELAAAITFRVSPEA